MSRKTVIIVAIVIVIAAISVWLLLRKKVATIPGINGAPPAKPDLTANTEAEALAAAEAATQALKEARESEYEEKIAEMAALIANMEAKLADLQAIAILKPSDQDLAIQVAELEAKALAQRKELEAQWIADINFRLEKLKVAETGAIAAFSAYQTAIANVQYWINRADNANIGVQKTNIYLQKTTDPVLWEAYLADFNNYVKLVKTYKDKAQDAKLIAVATHSQAVLAISKADDLAGDVLALTRDLQNLKILLELAIRTDAIARATRMKFAEMERLLLDPDSIIVPEYAIPVTPSAPTPVTEVPGWYAPEVPYGYL